jgi:uncharacterized protein YndB with AHSA1/START domain
MEYASIEREIHIDATPEVVYDVITSPTHMREWWGGVSATFQPTSGATGQLVFGHDGEGEDHVEPITVVDAVPSKLFSFRWVYPKGQSPAPDNSLLVTFELAAAGSGTTLRMTENGFREIGWEEAVAVASYQDHVNGWDTFIPNIPQYVARLASAS